MKINTTMMGVLSTVTCDGRLARMPPLDRKVYLEVDKILQALGGKWDRGKKAHVFPGGTFDSPASDAIDAAILTGEVTTARDIGFFPTPDALAARLVRESSIELGMRCLEPSAGTGAIVHHLLAAGGKVTAVERDPKMAHALMVRYANLSSEKFVSIDCDFLATGAWIGRINSLDGVRTFDRVVMNPPFIGKEHLAHVRHAFSLLSPGGLLKSVLPMGVMFREDASHVAFREWAVRHEGEFEELPEQALKSSGTNVRTCVLTVSR